MNKRSLSHITINLLALTLLACGQISDLLDNAEPQTSVSVSGFSWQIKSQAPHKFGGHWNRIITMYSDKEPFANLRVEKRTADKLEFRFVGLSDDSGEFLDTNVSQKTQYRFGGKIKSKWMDTEVDLVLSNQKQELFGMQKLDPIKTKVIKASRLYIPAEEVIVLNHTSVQSIITKELIIEGELRAFKKDCTSGQSAGNLVIRAHTIHGNGLIHWGGCNGKHGTRGPAGKAGQNAKGNNNVGSNGGPGGRGSNGSNAGNGGTLTIRVDELKLKSDQIVLRGGEGGLAGAGGHGGRGGRGQDVTRRMGGERDVEYIDKAIDGKKGPTGSKGTAGKNGIEGILRLLPY